MENVKLTLTDVKKKKKTQTTQNGSKQLSIIPALWTPEYECGPML